MMFHYVIFSNACSVLTIISLVQHIYMLPSFNLKCHFMQTSF